MSDREGGLLFSGSTPATTASMEPGPCQTGRALGPKPLNSNTIWARCRATAAFGARRAVQVGTLLAGPLE